MNLIKFNPIYSIVFFSIIFSITSCKKIDFSTDEINKKQNDLALLFLKIPDNANPIFSRILNTIKIQDSKSHFLNQFALKEGLPIWKASKIIVNNKIDYSYFKQNSNSTRTNNNDTIVLVPLVLKDSSQVTSFLTCNVTQDTVFIKLIRAREYKNYSFNDKKTDTITAKAVALQLMSFQKNIFGDSTFLIKDSRLFNYRNASGGSVKSKYITLRSSPPRQSNLNFITYTECHNVVHDGNQGQLVGLEPGANNDDSYYETVCYTNTVWFDSQSSGSSTGSSTGTDGSGGSSTSTGGTTTGSGGGWYDGGSIDNCPEAYITHDPTVGCGYGWVPIVQDPIPIPAFVWAYPGDDGTTYIDPDPSLQPEFRFDPIDNYESLYPTFTNLVKTLKDFVKNSPQVMAALQYYSGFSKTKILELLTYGKGPIIKIEEMGIKFGYYNKDAGINILHIRASYIRGLETAFLEDTKRGTAFLLGITILHEFVHYGRQINNLQAGVYEWGQGFERDAIGVFINELNANKISITYDKYF